MFEIRGLTEVIEAIKDVEKQTAYASSVALNNVAARIQGAEIDEANKVFTMRKNWIRKNTKFGINRNYANKSRLEVTIGSKAPWLEFQEEGGTKTKDKGTYDPILIPVSAIQTTKGRQVLKKFSLSTLKTNEAAKEKAGAFEINGAWFYRVADKVTPLFIKASSVKVKARYHFTELGTKMFAEQYDDEFSRAFKAAMATSLVR